MLLVGCSSEGQTEQAETAVVGTIVTYEVTTKDVQTRTEAISSSNYATEGRTFRIWAWMNDGANAYPMTSDFNTIPLYDKDVVYTSGKWTPSASDGTFYWPRPKYRLDCYAVFPNTAPFNPEAKTIDFSTSTVSGSDDVMYATFTGQREDRGTETSKAVSLTFNHILSQIQFKANKASELIVTITSLEICNVYSEGVFTIGSIAPTPETPSWGSLGKLTTYELPLKTASVNLTAEAQPLNGTDGVLMLLPQTRSKWDTATTIGANDTDTKGTYLKIGCSVVMGNTDYADDGYIYYPLDIDWEPGKNYTYTLGFGTGYDKNGNKTLQDINLSSSVTDWVSGGTETNPSDIHI